MNNKPVGILDSGIGGISIYREIVRLLPNESTVYVADSLNIPYGKKSKEDIYYLSQKLITFLFKKKVKAIVIGCNTITVSCLNLLRNDYPALPLIGTVPVIKTAARITKNKKIGILSTTQTANSQYQQDLISLYAGSCFVKNVGTNALVPFIERGEVRGRNIERVLVEVLKQFQNERVDTLVLGCTHFPFLAPVIKEMLGTDVHVLDSGEAVARQVKRILEKNKALSDTKISTHDFYTTGEKQILSDILIKQNIAHGIIESIKI